MGKGGSSYVKIQGLDAAKGRSRLIGQPLAGKEEARRGSGMKLSDGTRLALRSTTRASFKKKTYLPVYLYLFSFWIENGEESRTPKRNNLLRCCWIGSFVTHRVGHALVGGHVVER